MHNFNKYGVFNFNEISSIDSKFDTLNKFYEDFVNSQTKETKKKSKRE